MFASRSIRLGNETFYPLETVIELIRYCSDHGLAVLGLEGFSYRDGTVVARLDRTVDFADWRPAGNEDRREGNDQILDILREWTDENDLVFVVFLEEEADAGSTDDIRQVDGGEA